MVAEPAKPFSRIADGLESPCSQDGTSCAQLPSKKSSKAWAVPHRLLWTTGSTHAPVERVKDLAVEFDQ